MAELSRSLLMRPEGSSTGTGTTGDHTAALAAARQREISAFRVCRGCENCKEVWFNPTPMLICVGGRNPHENDPARAIARVLNEFRCPKAKTMRDVQD